jgi:hypothetical protein
MTAKEKSDQLINMYYAITYDKIKAIQCAVLSIFELLSVNTKSSAVIYTYYNDVLKELINRFEE